MKVFHDLTHDEWALVQNLFCTGDAPKGRRGRPPVEARAVLNAVLWVVASRESWNNLPDRYPSQPTCRRRFETWQADGTLAEVVRRLRSSGRHISLRDRVRATAAKAPAQSFNERLRGAFWTNPTSWRTDLTEHYRQSD